MLYPKNEREKLSKKLFENPTCEYRGTPFWAWNCQLDKDELMRQIEVFKEMGLGGFHMHVRTGMATRYLSDEYMDLVRACRDKAEQEKMLCWLYDEDRWPSGAAGGLVTRDRKYAQRYLLFTKSNQLPPESKLLGTYKITLKDGYLAHYEVLAGNAAPAADIRYAYLSLSPTSSWFNNQSYLNTLDPAAVRKFVEVTHERYKQCVGESFGKSIPAIFTDEPQFSRKETLGFADSDQAVELPFTDDLPETFAKQYGEDIIAHIPELFWDLPDGKISLIRYHYHDHIAERFANAFADTVGGWCKKNGIMLTGHMMAEPSLLSQTAALGEAMRSYRSFQLPGIDMLCDKREFTTAKQAASAARQFGCPGVLSELYGVTNWDFDFRGHKLQGDWQAALGVTVRVHHLAWVSMQGDAKRDYPASISYQSPWYKDYSYVEEYFGRVNTALTRGKPVCHVGMIHPVESYWLHWGPREQTAAVRDEMEGNFRNMCNWLLLGHIDFDYIAESLLPAQCKKAAAPLNVGQEAYDVVLVPGCETIRATTLDRLEAFRKAGGRLVFVGRIPTLVDAQPSDRAQKLAAQSECIAMSRYEVMNALRDVREIEIRNELGERSDHFLYQMREDNDARWLFISQAYTPEYRDSVARVCVPTRRVDVSVPEKCTITVRGLWHAEKWNALNGKVEKITQRQENGMTIISSTFDAHDSLLMQLTPSENAKAVAVPQRALTAGLTEIRPMNPVELRREEANVLMLDQAQYSLDGDEWQPREEILRLDNIARARLGRGERTGHVPQPWVTAGEDPHRGEHTLALRFAIDARTVVKDAHLALETPEDATVTLDGKPVRMRVDGWYVDKSIQTIKLPGLAKGIHELVVTYDYHLNAKPEWMYLLGDFDVCVAGDSAYLTAPTHTAYYGDLTHQGLPFYGGSVTYVIPVKTGTNGLVLEASHYRGGAMHVYLDDTDEGVLAYAPYQLKMDCAPGKHTLRITVYGNRINTFGTVHLGDTRNWYGPPAWQSEGAAWRYEYRLEETGLITAPRLFI